MANRITKAQKQKLLAAMAFGATVENAARLAGIGERSAYRIRDDPACRAQLDQLRFETLLRTSGMLAGATLVSVKTLVDLQQDASTPATVRQRCALGALDQAVKYSKFTGQQQRVVEAPEEPPQQRLQTAQDVIDLLQEQVETLLADGEVGAVQKARTIGYLASLARKAIETGTLADRLEMLNAILRQRKENEEK
jgi:hypothetical protein